MLKFFEPKPFFLGLGAIVAVQFLWFLLIPLFFLGQVGVQDGIDITIKIMMMLSIIISFFWSKSLSLGLLLGYLLIYFVPGLGYYLR